MGAYGVIKKIISAICILMPSFITCFVFRLMGHQIGKNSKIRILSYIYADKIAIGNDVEIRSFVFIQVNTLTLGHNTVISFGTQIKGDQSFTAKGCNFIGLHCLINCEDNVSLGFYSGLGPRSTIYTHGSFLPITLGYPAKFEPVVIEDYVWVGMAVTILPGTHIESNCIINPGVMLKSRIRANSLIEFKSATFSVMKLNQLQAFLKQLPASQLSTIIENFLIYEHMEYTHHKEDNRFSSGKTCVFRYFSETGIIELFVKNKKITYDMTRFSTDFSTSVLHKRFLFFLRRRCGIILQTRYKN